MRRPRVPRRLLARTFTKSSEAHGCMWTLLVQRSLMTEQRATASRSYWGYFKLTDSGTNELRWKLVGMAVRARMPGLAAAPLAEASLCADESRSSKPQLAA